MTKQQKKPAEGAIATNRRARHDYEIEQTYEAGIQLVGSEVKSLRDGKASLQDSYATVRNGEVFVYGVHIPEYPQASIQNHEPTRIRKLLLHSHEIGKIQTKTAQQGYTLVPLKLYFKGNKVKVTLNDQVVIDGVQLNGIPAEGPIGLKYCGDEVEFANVFVREL